MNDIVPRSHQDLARTFRSLAASYEANRDLVLMGAYRPGADAVLDRAIAMHDRLTGFLGQRVGEVITIGESVSQLERMLDEG